MSAPKSSTTVEPLGTSAKDESSKSDSYTPYYIALAVLVVVGLALGLGLGLGLKKSTSAPTLYVPPFQPPVTTAVPSSLRPSNAAWVNTQANLPRIPRIGLQALTTTIATDYIKSRIFGPGPTDFVTRLGYIDSRMQEFVTRQREGNGRVCVSEASKQWNPTFLPSGASFPMWFSCQEYLGASSGLTLYFGQSSTKSYVAEIQDPPAGSTMPRMAVLASVASNGTQVEAWQIITGTNTVSYFQLVADKTVRSVELSFASTDGNAFDLGCGFRARITSALTWSVGDFRDSSQMSSSPCTGSPNLSVCVDTPTLSAQSSVSACSGIQSFTVSDMTTASLAAQGLPARALASIQAPGVPTLTSFNITA